MHKKNQSELLSLNFYASDIINGKLPDSADEDHVNPFGRKSPKANDPKCFVMLELLLGDSITPLTLCSVYL